MSRTANETHWLLWPFVFLWRLVAGIVELTGRLLAVLLGLAIMVIGIVLSVTIIGAVLGTPLLILGFMLVLRGLF